MPKLSQQTHITIRGQLQNVDSILDEVGQRLCSVSMNGTSTGNILQD